MKLNLIVKILIGVVAGILIGLYCPLPVVQVLDSFGYVLGQYIKFVIPLLIIAFVAKGIADFGSRASKGLLIGLVLAYVSTILAELLGFSVGSFALTHLGIVNSTISEAAKITPYLKIDIPPIMTIMSALVFSVVLGLGITWVGKKTLHAAIDEFSTIVTRLVKKGMIPVFPFFVASVFMEVAAKGQLIPTAKAFAQVLLLIIPTQWVWLLVLYAVASVYTRKNMMGSIKYMLPAYFTACGTMSSAATLPVAIECANQIPGIKKQTINFCMPLFNIAHLPGAAMAITMSALTVSFLTKGALPSLGSFLPFMLLLGLIEVAAVGVPGGSVTAALGILESVLGLDATGLGLMVALFMIQDSFGTAANVTGDAALTIIVDKALGEEDVAAADQSIPA
jgi:Na+/H+-dicarboxylate symporter